MFENKVVVVTGGARGIGRTICAKFAAAGAHVCLIDINKNEYFVGDITSEETLQQFADKVLADFGRVDYLVNNACLSRGGLFDCSYDDFNYVLQTGITAPFMLTKLFRQHFNRGAAIVNISSSRDRMSQPNTESYTAAKGGISALTHALAVSLAGKVRVNSISPGWIDTQDGNYSGPDAKQHPICRVGKPEDIADLVLFLCSEKSGFITGENITVDGGMTRLMIYHGEHGWSYAGNDGD